MAGIAPQQTLVHDFDQFLYASVGEDRSGYAVTVLSALARLGFDPWTEASALAALSRDAARNRISKLLADFRDVPTLVLEHGAMADKLTLLLPAHASRTSTPTGASASGARKISTGTIIAICTALVVIVQLFFLGRGGSGD